MIGEKVKRFLFFNQINKQMSITTCAAKNHHSTGKISSMMEMKHLNFVSSSNRNEAVVPKSLNELIEMIRFEMKDKGLMDDVDVGRIQNIMQNYESKKEEWEPFAFFDKYRYTRNLIDDGNGKYNLILLCWNVNQQSPIHDHSGSHCILKVMQGELLETRYDWPSCSSEMRKTIETKLLLDEAGYMSDKIGLHSISNCSSDIPAVSLHLYSPPIEICQTFCEENGNCRKSGKCVFYSINGTKNENCSSGLCIGEIK